MDVQSPLTLRLEYLTALVFSNRRLYVIGIHNFNHSHLKGCPLEAYMGSLMSNSSAAYVLRDSLGDLFMLKEEVHICASNLIILHRTSTAKVCRVHKDIADRYLVYEKYVGHESRRTV